MHNTRLSPTAWKEANIEPIFKKNDPSEIFNYQPNSLHHTADTAMENMAHKHAYYYLFFKDNSIIKTLSQVLIS